MSVDTQQVSTRLEDDKPRLLDAHWRAANYLSVGQIHLTDNPLLNELLRPKARQTAAAGPRGVPLCLWSRETVLR